MAIHGAVNAMDFAGLTALRSRADQSDPEVLREVARQFESLFTSMMLKNMRAASFGDPLFGNSDMETYRDMFDQQVAVEMSRGRGLGIAEMLVRQLSGTVARASDASGGPRGSGISIPAASAGLTAAQGGAPEPADFVQELWPHVREAAGRLGVDPRVIMAQAALETGWGRSMPAGADGRPSHNLFGIKADSGWRGASVAADTMEFDGHSLSMSRARFRSYDSFSQGVRDYVKFLSSNPRYQQALESGGDPEAFARGLQAAGYATDPDYASKLISILESGRLDALAPGLKFGSASPITTADAAVSRQNRGAPDAFGA